MMYYARDIITKSNLNNYDYTKYVNSIITYYSHTVPKYISTIITRPLNVRDLHSLVLRMS